MDRDQIFHETHERFSSTIRGHLYKTINNREDADQVFQDVFFNFWVSLKNFEGKSKPSTFLYRIAQRKISDYLRKEYKRIDRYPNWLAFRSMFRSVSDQEYMDKTEKALDINVNPLNVLIVLTEGETRDLLLAIKKTKERSELS